jgi:hypothetical protein
MEISKKPWPVLSVCGIKNWGNAGFDATGADYLLKTRQEYYFRRR